MLPSSSMTFCAEFLGWIDFPCILTVHVIYPLHCYIVKGFFFSNSFQKSPRVSKMPHLPLSWVSRWDGDWLPHVPTLGTMPVLSVTILPHTSALGAHQITHVLLLQHGKAIRRLVPPTSPFCSGWPLNRVSLLLCLIFIPLHFPLELSCRGLELSEGFAHALSISISLRWPLNCTWHRSLRTDVNRDRWRNDNWVGVTDSLTVSNGRWREWARGRRFNKPRLMIWCAMSPLCC